MKILAAIANHGTKNKHFLDQLIAAYREMRHDVTIVVLSDKPKVGMPADIEVMVGAPTTNPWSLPFAHRPLFADRVKDFDLFIYSEDDTLIEERHVEAFMRMCTILPDDEIPGFLRYETRPSGERSYCSIHSHYRWDTATVERRGGEVFAFITNEHSACYMLTREQLRKAIDSGGFLVAPHEGVFDMLVSAATDPYTRCGFKRRIAISRMDDFLLHHLPNVYLDKLGIDPRDFEVQLEALKDIASGTRSGQVLVDPGSKLPIHQWSMGCYPRASDELKGCLSGTVDNALSVGSTAGILERELFGESATITGIPVDSVLGAAAQLRKIETTPPDWVEAMKQIRGRSFDVVLLSDVLQRFPDPGRALQDIREAVANKPQFVITMPNWWHYRLLKAVRGRPSSFPRGFSESGMHQSTWRNLMRWLRDGGFSVDMCAFEDQGRIGSVVKSFPKFGRTWLSQKFIVMATPV